MLIEHVAIGLNYIDIIIDQDYIPVTCHQELELEASGIIKEIGSNVSKILKLEINMLMQVFLWELTLLIEFIQQKI